MVENVLCSYCNWPGTFYVWKGSEIVKVTDPLVRITTKKSITTMYAHKGCHRKNGG